MHVHRHRPPGRLKAEHSLHEQVTAAALILVLAELAAVGRGRAPLPGDGVDALVDEFPVFVESRLEVADLAARGQPHDEPLPLGLEHDAPAGDGVDFAGVLHSALGCVLKVPPALYDLRMRVAPKNLQRFTRHPDLRIEGALALRSGD